MQPSTPRTTLPGLSAPRRGTSGRSASSDSAGLPPSNGTASFGWLDGRQIWITAAVIWTFFGLAVAGQLYFSMRHHGHDWWRIVVWQLAGAATWMLLSPLVLHLKRRFPFDAARRRWSIPVHLSVALAGSLGRLVPMTLISRTLDPYRPVSSEASFGSEYLAQLVQWLPLDLLIYCAILVVAHFLEYREQVHRDQLRSALLEAELVDAELRALKLELQPHFLFNTLNAVVGLVRGSHNDRAERMLLGVSDLLRKILGDRRQQLVPLAEERRTTDLYLDIQRTRFGDRLDFRWRVEASCEEAAVPSLLLQPLIENAVRHAVELGSGRGLIEVRIRHSGDRLEIAVEDSGSASTNDDSAAVVGSGIGLDNVRSRLEALFGDDWSLELALVPGRGARVVVSFPWRTLGAETDGP